MRHRQPMVLGSPRATLSRLVAMVAWGAVASLATQAAEAQQRSPRSIESGDERLITAMGQPSPWGYFLAGDVGLQPIAERQLSAQLSLGVERALLNPMLSALALTGEYYMGVRGQAGGQVGFRAGIEFPFLRLGAGWQYEFRASDSRPYFMLRHPLRRGGVLWPGAQARLLWAPGDDQSLTLGITAPLAKPFAGKTRPLEAKAIIPLPLAATPPAPRPLPPRVTAALGAADSSAARVARLFVPFLGSSSDDALRAEGAVAKAVRRLAADVGTPATRAAGEAGIAESAPMAAVRAYHAAMAAAFADEAASTSIPADTFAAAARRALLDHLVLPYNRLLGRKRGPDTFAQLAARARVAFAREMVLRRGLDLPRIESAEAVFEGLLEIILRIERRLVRQWDDERLAFLPLPLALVPEEHDSQQEIADLAGRAVEDRFTPGNEAWYVVNEQFQWELLRMIQDTRRYHVLWIHDFRANDDGGQPDAVSYRTVLDGYLDALADRIEAYDREGTLPVFMIFIDQWYYQVNDGRFWLSLLEDPMHHELDLPDGHEAWEAELRRAQERLRRAVASSRVLQAEAREYGEEWLRNRVRVQVNVTNPADPTFWTRELVPWIGFPDLMIRDHRKVTFFDIDPRDPTRGRALYTGMGVGEIYDSPAWDDRSMLVRGPVLRSLRAATRELLLQQGFEPEDIPYPLQDAQDVGARAEEVRAVPADASSALMMEVHNAVGYGPKRASVLKATLYCLMPPGAVVKAPDSLWNFPLWASLLTGLSLRGGRVMIVAPSIENAPAQSFGSIELARHVLGQVVRASADLAPAIASAGGLLRVGMYRPATAVGDIPGKVRQVAATFRATPWLRQLHGFAAGDRSLEQLADSLERAGFRARYLEGEAIGAPKLHMKAHWFATAEAWTPLMVRPESEAFLRAYMRQRAVLLQQGGEDRDLRALQRALAPATDALARAWMRNTTPAGRDRAAWFLLVGSHNQNFRSAMLDGEVVVAVAGAEAVIGLADLTMILGLSEWMEQPQDLEPHFPPISGFMRGLGNWARILF